MSVKSSNVVGIDIGNDKCVVAIVKPKVIIQILMNHDAKYEFPSVVSFTKKKRQIGTEKASLAMLNPQSTITQVKRLIGQNFDEPGMVEELKMFPFKTSKAEDGGIVIHVEYLKKEWTFTPVEILAMLLCHLKQMIEQNDADWPVSDCVISVPSYFNDLQRIAYLNAAEIAGLNPLRLMNDGTAIALGYGYFKTELDSPVIVVFIDVGHSDTQVTVAQFDREGVRILAHAFDRKLGGRDFDRVLYNHFLEVFNTNYEINIESNQRATVRLMSACEKVKTMLTANKEANISIDCLVNDIGVDGSIKRDDFDKLSSHLTERLTTTLKVALMDAKLENAQINSVEIVGSGSRIPAFSNVVSNVFGMKPIRTLNGSDCVARGCALHCSMLNGSRGFREYKVQDSIPFSVGLSWISRLRKIPEDDENQNTQIPKPSSFNVQSGSSSPSRNKTKSSDDSDASSVSNPSDSHQISSLLLFKKGRRIPRTQIVEFAEASQKFQFSTFYEYKGGSTPSLSQKSRTFEVDVIKIDSNKSIPMRVEISIDLYGMIVIKSASQPKSVENLKCNEILPMGMSKDSIREAQEREEALLEHDREVDDVQRQKNDIEAFIYSTRKELNGRYEGYAKKSEKERILKKLDASETWLSENDDEKSAVYSNELHALKKLVNSIENRYKHFIDCMEATEDLEVSIAELNRLLKSKEVVNYYGHHTDWLWAVKQLLKLLPKDIDQLPDLLEKILKITRLAMDERCRLSESRNMEDCHLTMVACASKFRDANKYSLCECHEGEQKKRERWLLVDETCTRLSKLLDTIAPNSFGEDDELYHEAMESPLEENDQDNHLDKLMSEIQPSKKPEEDSSNNAVVAPSSSQFNRGQTGRTTEEMESINSTISDIQLKLSERYGDFIDQQEKDETDNKLNEIKNRLLDFGIGDNELYDIVKPKILEFRQHLADVEEGYTKEETTDQRRAQPLYMIFDSRVKIMCIAISGSDIIKDKKFNSLEERVRITCDNVEKKYEEMKPQDTLHCEKEDTKILKREKKDKKIVRTTEKMESINSTISDIQLKLSERYGDFFDQQEKDETDNKLNEIKNRLLDFGIGDNKLYHIVKPNILEFRQHLADVEEGYTKEDTTDQRRAQALYMIFDSRVKIMCIAISGSDIIRDEKFNILEERVRITCGNVEKKYEEMKQQDTLPCEKEDTKILKRLLKEIQQFEESQETVIEEINTEATLPLLQPQIHSLADTITVETENEVAVLVESISDIEKKVFGRYRYVAGADEMKYISKIIKKISGLLQRRGRTGDAFMIWSREKGKLEYVIATLEIRYNECKSEISLAAEELCDCIFDHLRTAKSEIVSSSNATLIKKQCGEDEKWLDKNFPIARGNPIRKIDIDMRKEALNKYCEGIKRNDPHNMSRGRIHVRNPFKLLSRN